MLEHVSSQTSRHPPWLLAGFWVCVVIAIGVVLRRLVEFISPSRGGPPQMASLNATFSSHVVLTLMHIIPAAIFVLLSAAVLLRRTGADWLERLFFPFGTITGATAYAMSSLRRRRLGRTLRRPCVQHLVPVLAGSCLLVSPPRRALAKAGVDDPRRGYPAWYPNHSSRDGSILRHEFPHASWPEPVLRHRVLDRLLH
jgi:hypothetical protein